MREYPLTNPKGYIFLPTLVFFATFGAAALAVVTKLYDKTTADMTNNSANPFMPYNGYVGSKSDIVKMKPAPSDDTVYYLTVSIDLDWGELPDADVK